MHIYLPSSLFVLPSQPDLIHELNGNFAASSLSTLCKIVDRVQKHVCCHFSFSDIKTLLQRNNFWSDADDDQLQTTVCRYRNCRAISKPQPSCKVSPSSLNRGLKDEAYVDLFFLDSQPLLHVMDVTTRFSLALIAPNTSFYN